MTDILERIEKVNGVAARKDELLSFHTSFRVGGPCDLMVWVSTGEALKEVLALARSHSLPSLVLGNGSNVLVRDGGISGVVLRLVDQFAGVQIEGDHVSAGAGAGLADVVSKATSSGIGGLEFLAGIPGTVGGAVMTNAGSGDVWFSNRLLGLSVLTGDLRELSLETADVGFDYRYCSIDKDWVVTGVTLGGYRCSVEDARRRVEDHLEMRRQTQPSGELTAGCVFKNPPGDAAGRIIERAGLKGFRIGAAQVSSIHANWIVNTGGATAREILDLVGEIQHRVKDMYGIDLELEINVLGKD